MSHYNTVSKYKAKLRELHDLIKENPFRKGYEPYIDFGPGYFEIVYEFAETFYHLIKDIRENLFSNINELDNKLAKVDCLDFIHDFYSACTISKAAVRRYQKDNNPDFIQMIHKQEELLEWDISCIHTYLETGVFDRYPSKSKDGILWSEWNEDTESYEYVSQNQKQLIQ